MLKRNKRSNKGIDDDSVGFSLEESLKKYGALFPILVSKKYGIIDGRHRAKSSMGLTIPRREIKVDSEIDFHILRIHSNLRAKTDEEYRQQMTESISRVFELLKEENPRMKQTELEKLTASTIGIGVRTVRKYLKPSLKKFQKNLARCAKNLDSYRTQVRLSLERYHPEQRQILKEILRNSKPYFRSKDDLDLFWRLCRSSKEDPFSIWIEHFYLDKGEGRGFQPRLKYKYKIGLELLASQSAEEKDPVSILEELVDEGLKEAGISEEDLIREAKRRFKEEWLLDDSE